MSPELRAAQAYVMRREVEVSQAKADAEMRLALLCEEELVLITLRATLFD